MLSQTFPLNKPFGIGWYIFELQYDYVQCVHRTFHFYSHGLDSFSQMALL